MSLIAVTALLTLGASAADTGSSPGGLANIPEVCLNTGDRLDVRLSIPGGAIARFCTGDTSPKFVNCDEWKKCGPIYNIEKHDVSGALDWSSVEGLSELEDGTDPEVAFGEVCCNMDEPDSEDDFDEVPQSETKKETWTKYENKQCAFEDVDGEINDDPIFRSKRKIPLEACMDHCLTSTDMYGRPCVAIEMKRDAGAHKRVQCRLAWSCDIQTPNDHLDVWTMPAWMIHGFLRDTRPVSGADSESEPNQRRLLERLQKHL